ncbi:MAG: LacI family DNA-binding transcriptional regulator [Candidatus Dormibacteraeota bacterium]|nr:LacI family DNA-binding transcriptional regulator [Candidatus Dormibacteraeota bacterium]
MTLKELAARAGVHPATVSRVANNDPGLRISTTTRERIQALLRETGYQPDAMARGLRTRRSFVVAMVIPDITNNLFAGIYKGLEEAAGERGFSVLACNTDGDPRRERAHLETLLARRVAGVVLASSVLRDPSVSWLRAHNVPHVLVSRYSDTSHAFVGSDDVTGGRIATHHLLDLGHRRIAYLSGGSRTSTGLLRSRGYRQALAQAGVLVDDELEVETGYLEQPATRAMARLLELPEPPSAVFAGNDLIALGAITAAQQVGLRVPRDLAVVGYNDIPLAARLGVSTMRIPMHEFGRVSARILLDQVASGSQSGERVIFQPELVVRSSTVCPD